MGGESNADRVLDEEEVTFGGNNSREDMPAKSKAGDISFVKLERRRETR